MRPMEGVEGLPISTVYARTSPAHTHTGEKGQPSTPSIVPGAATLLDRIERAIRCRAELRGDDPADVERLREDVRRQPDLALADLAEHFEAEAGRWERVCNVVMADACSAEQRAAAGDPAGSPLNPSPNP